MKTTVYLPFFRFHIWLLGFCMFPTLLSAQFDLYYGIPSQVKRSHTFGISAGTGLLLADIPATVPGINMGIYYQRRINRPVDIKIDLRGGRYLGEDVDPSRGFLLNRQLNGIADSTRAYDSTATFFQNYQSEWGSATIAFKLNINRLIASSGSENWEAYLTAGVGAFMYRTRMDAFDETGATYRFQDVPVDNLEATRTALQDLRDGRYETPGEQDLLNNSIFGDFVVNTTFLAGVGGHVSITKAWGIGLEGTIQSLGDDLIDGQQWTQVDGVLEQSLSRDNLVQISLLVDFSF